MKRKHLEAKIANAAKETGIEFVLVREGANHSIFRCGTERVVIARHTEITEGTAVGTLRKLEVLFGKGWWRT